jgi:hypothetical protein
MMEKMIKINLRKGKLSSRRCMEAPTLEVPHLIKPKHLRHISKVDQFSETAKKEQVLIHLKITAKSQAQSRER